MKFSTSRKVLIPFLLLLVGISGIIFLQTKSRLAKQHKKFSQKLSTSENFTSIEKPKATNSISKASTTAQSSTPALSKYDEWCEAKEYKDLSDHEIFKRFETWIAGFERLSCDVEKNCTLHIHDPRKLAQFLSLGEKLSLERKKVFEKIIRGDPAKAISMAMTAKSLKGLPQRISKNIETWHSEKVDLDSIHVCYDERHPEGLIKRFAQLSNGQRIRVWTFGEREKIKTVKGLAVWGVSLGEDFAMSEYPYRETNNEGIKALHFAGMEYPYDDELQKELFIEELKSAERKVSLISRRVGYPIMAGSSSLSDYYEKKYDIILTPMTWADANNTAFGKNGRLVVINSQKENDFILDQYKDAGATGFDNTGNTVRYGWIGATDSPDQNGSTFDSDTNVSSIIEINATDGDWKWLDGKDVTDTIADFDTNFQTMWLGGNDPVDPTKNFGAMDWTTADGNWTDVNESYRLPFVIEYDLGDEPAPNAVAAKGFRKVLVVPARFQDEGYGLNGSSAPLTDQFGNPIYPDLQQDAFDPVSQTNLANAMEEVTKYFSDNSDGIFKIIPVISPTVTIPLDKYEMGGSGDPNIFDSSGQLVGAVEVTHNELGDDAIGEWGVIMAAQQGEKYHIGDHYFWGISDITLTGATVGTGYTEEAPVISFVVGNQNPADNNLTHPDFEPCEARALVNANGEITDVEILNPGAWYYSNPTVLINGVVSNDIVATASSIAISWVTISTHTPGAAGLGYVGAAGSHVDASGGNVSWGVIAHELGHNFGLLHANRFYSLSERPNSDEGSYHEYGNPYAVMGSGSGHMTLPAKVAMSANGFGYHAGTSVGDDVANLISRANLITAVSNNLDLNNSEHNNTFRIYRHDYETYPASLHEQEFYVNISGSNFDITDFNYSSIYTVSFSGTGEGATGTLTTDNTNLAILEITNGGRGFAEDPTVDVLNDQNETIFRLDPTWIEVRAGTDTFVQATLRNLEAHSPRGLRGIGVQLSEFSPIGTDSGENMQTMWLSYRREASEKGLSVLLGDGFTENFWIDITPSTIDDFSDAFLMPGRTFSDYSTDVHITPVSKGGIEPMEYIDVVVNIGSMAAGDAEAPNLLIDVSNQFPSVGEFVEMSVRVQDRNTSDFAFTWYVNEVHQTEDIALNRSFFYKSFNEAGEYVVRVVVSDMKGGIASRNIVIKAGDYQKNPTSSVSGTVRSLKGNVQGARVILSPAEVIEHTVSLTGNDKDWFLPTGRNNPNVFLIDDQAAPELIFRRGEIHRFKFAVSTDTVPLAFFDHPEHEMPRIRLKMLVRPQVDENGDNYTTPPEVKVVGGSMFANYLSNDIATIAEFNQTSDSLMVDDENLFEVNRPYAKHYFKIQCYIRSRTTSGIE